MRKNLLIAFSQCVLVWLSISSPAVWAQANEKLEAEYWETADLVFEDFAELLTPEGCYRNQTYFLACIDGIDEILEKRQLRQIILPEVDLSGFQITELTAEAEKKSEQLWKALYENDTKENERTIDFNEISEWIHDSLLTDDNEAELTAAAYNAFLLRTEDRYAYIIPRLLYESENESGGLDVVEDVLSGQMIESEGLNIGYLRLESLSEENIYQHVETAVIELSQSGIEGFILDLR